MPRKPGPPVWRDSFHVDISIEQEPDTGQGFRGLAHVHVTLDNSGDETTPNAPPEVDVLEVQGQFAESRESDFVPVRWDGVHVPSWIVSAVETVAVEKALQLIDGNPLVRFARSLIAA